jgi:hypothetical protein
MNAHLLDTLIAVGNIKNDAALARRLEISPSVICKQRQEKIAVSPGYMIYIHEAFDMPIAEIKHLIGLEQLA